MKKYWLAIALAMAMGTAVVGCGEQNITPPATSNTAPSASSTSASPGLTSALAVAPKIEMTEQIYRDNAMIEIPQFTSEESSTAIDLLNLRLDTEQRMAYQAFEKENPEENGLEIKSYPFVDDNYVQVIVTQFHYPTYGTQGDVFSYNYDVKNNRAMELQDGLTKASITKEDIEQKCKDFIEKQDAEQNFPQTVKSIEIQGFRILEGGAEFYVKVSLLPTEAEPHDQIYLYNSALDSVTEYDGRFLFDANTPTPMTPALAFQTPEKFTREA